MRIVVVDNPIAGRGHASREATRVESVLRQHGHTPERVSVEHGALPQDFPERLDGADALIVVGGDGTVIACAEHASDTGTPLFHWPMGTENLFAREFGMRRDRTLLLHLLEGMRTRTVDMARCDGQPFIIMCSVGPDASVIHRLARVRRGGITRRHYVRHVFSELFRPTLTPLSVVVDGQPLVEDRPGMVIVANSRQYALRIDPAKDASMTDGLLDVVYFPVSTRLGMLKWLALSRVRRQGDVSGSRFTRGSRVRVVNHGSPVPYQLDGEAEGALGMPRVGDSGSASQIDIEVVPQRLRVLCP